MPARFQIHLPAYFSLSKVRLSPLEALRIAVIGRGRSCLHQADVFMSELAGDTSSSGFSAGWTADGRSASQASAFPLGANVMIDTVYHAPRTERTARGFATPPGRATELRPLR